MLRAGVPFGLVILESPDLDVFDEQVLADLERLVRSAAPQLETALLFEEVRSAASGEERDRLARQMHDGVAQELASVGYRLDSLRSRAASVDPALADEVAQVRAEMTRVISDIRLSITDLTTTLGPERGLGAALSGYLRAVCSGKDVVLHLSLQESAFRLPPDQEVLLANLTHAFAQQVRESRLVRNLWVDLEVDPPSGRLRLEHDGPGDLSADLSRYCLPLVNAGAHVSASHGLNGSPRLDVSLEGSADDHQRPARR